MLLYFLALLPVAIWGFLLVARGGFWRVSKQLPPKQYQSRQVHVERRIVAVIPARDEAESIGQTIRSLLNQSSPPHQIVLVDDNSSDGTAAVAQEAATEEGKTGGLTVISGKPLPKNWTGKLWALQQGITAACELDPDFVLLTDADISYGHDSLRTLATIAERQHFDLVSFMVRLSCQSFAEKATIPAFVFFFFLLYPPSFVSSAKHSTAGAAGGCILIRPEILLKAGGLTSIRSEVIDDCALARVIKRSGGRIWLGLTEDMYSTRAYGSWSEITAMIARTAFNQLHHSVFLLTATTAGLVVVYVLPVVLLFTGKPLIRLCGALAYALMSVSYLPTVRFYRGSFLWALTLPGVALFYLFATIHSAVLFWRGRGGTWKGRVQDVRG